MATEIVLTPDWPAPLNVKAVSTTRQGGFSQAPFDSMNVGTHVGDDASVVKKNRDQLKQLIHLPNSPLWLEQVHGTDVIHTSSWKKSSQADAIYSDQPNHVCAIMTADCLPVLFTDRQGTQVAAAHAGWRGLLNGVLENTVSQFTGAREDILVWLGPAIGPTQFEVGQEVYAAFTAYSQDAKQAFKVSDQTHYLADIYLLAKQRLSALGITQIYGGDFCTVTEKQRFFSYRRDGITGRMVSLIWIVANKV
ncbi:peptidoglycan editing factor PgeF [Methylophaga thiooxydans]|uniref:peptidoglycan editing factor PgeF n=1 Tax=Methylophaga thiooxydans TaxID=392484 RepID=UPI002355CB63|nr:peptidoglycan editing factor PgeF [Methylophaga thiooxydans]